jgi:hypothetical protein
LLLAAFAFGWHNLVARGVNQCDSRGLAWPVRWW